MKIGTGIYKGKSLIVPEKGVKPTSDKVRQAVMNIIRPDLPQSRVLDLFCGTGSVGIECLSNGADFCFFVEKNPKMYSILKKNLYAVVEDESKFSTLKTNIVELSKPFDSEPYDFIFADPFYVDIPFFFERIYILAMKMLKPSGIFILEHGDKFDCTKYDFFQKTHRYGDSELSVFVKPEEETL